MKKSLLSIIIVACFVATAAVGQTTKDTLKPGKANDPMVVNPGRTNDKNTLAVMTDTGFINKSIADNLLEVAAARKGREKATSPLVKRIAGTLINDHTDMLAALRRVSADRHLRHIDLSNYPATLPAISIPPAADINATWGLTMLALHNAQIAQLQDFQVVTQDKELKDLIAHTLPMLGAHRDMLMKIPGVATNPDPNAIGH